MKQGATLPVLFANGRSYSNTSLGRATSNVRLFANGRSYSNTSLGRATSNVSLSSSIRQVFLANSCLKNAVQYRLPLKKLKPEPWQRLFYVKKQQESTIKQNNSNPDSLINKDLFASFNEHSNFDENSQCSSLPGPMQGHLDHVYEQMNEITLQLAEERLKHKQTQIKAEEILFNQLQDHEKRFQELQKHQLLDHKKKLKEQEKKFLELLNEKQMQCLKREEQLRTELEFTLQKTIVDTAVEREHIESLSKNLTSTKLELVETKERAVKLATKLNDLKIQHNETIREFNEYRLRSNEKTKQP
ncbi:unnamed protein product [Rotaria sp. Silwood1]|nr:unnamed protein product [Rotaria sp. Silwood1]